MSKSNKNVSLLDFEKYYNSDVTNEKIFASPFMDIDFITNIGQDIGHDIIIKYSNNLNRAEVYSKIIKQLYNIEKAVALEAGIFEFAIVYIVLNNLQHEYILSVYREKSNDILLNLDENSILQNKKLKYNILNNIIDPQEVPFIEAQKIHPDRWSTQIKKKELREFKNNNITYTNLYKCHKCKQRKCSVIQMQIRSADEPMTNIITCVNCQNVWKC